jgi:hypothetical protein
MLRNGNNVQWGQKEAGSYGFIILPGQSHTEIPIDAMLKHQPCFI